jgi:hypothetical protein
VRRYGVQRCRVDGGPGESFSRRALWRVLFPPRSGFEGGCVGTSRSVAASDADSRVRLTGVCKAHNSRRGGVLSSRTPTVSWMVLQCPGCHRRSGDGRTGPMVTEEARLTGPTSRRCPGRARDRRTSPFRGFRRPLSRARHAGRTRVGSAVSRS